MWGLIGNEQAVAALQRAVAAGTLAHAYLFAGPDGVGKGTLALKLAQALNCKADERPCGHCSSCRRIAGGLHADVQVVTVEPSDEGPQHKAISVGQVREVERAVALKPFEGSYRAVIVDPADAMNQEAQNAFLKTLEEPPPHVVFVLVTAREERLLATIRSRCRRLELRVLPAAAVADALRREGVEEERATLLARLSAGRIGWALAAVRDPSLLERRREALESARSLASATLAQRFDLAEALAGEFRRHREAVLERLLAWQGWWRDVLLVQSGAESAAANPDMLTALHEDAARCAPAEVAAFVRALTAARRHLEENVQPRLALEVLLLDAPGGGVPAVRFP